MKGNKSPSLAQFVKSNLGISAVEFAELEGMSGRTLRHRWKSAAMNQAVRDAVFRRRVQGYED